MSNQYYFAYGANMNVSRMHMRCPDAQLIGRAVVHEHRFEINSLGVGTIIQDIGHSVHGLMWKISREDELSLDKYEGVEMGCYLKQLHKVSLGDSYNDTSVMAYIATDSTPGIPSKVYLADIIIAAILEKFPSHYIDHLKSILRREKNNE